MRELNPIEKIYLEEYDVYVNPYLSYEQIQQIVRSVMTQEDWIVRQQTIDMLVLYHTTDIATEEFDKITHEDLLKSGLLEKVKGIVKNLNQIQEAIDYTQSLPRALKQISDKLPEFRKIIQEAVMKNGRENNK